MSIIERGTFVPGNNEDLGPDLAPVQDHPGRLGQWLGGICLIFVVAALFGLVAFHARIAEEQTRLDAIEQTLTEARVENDRLKLSVAQLESPARIVEKAKGVLGMTEAATIVYLTPPADALRAHDIEEAFKGRTHNDTAPDRNNLNAGVTP